ncbi:protein AF-10-like isoform X2 [Sitodiplosis mosellana]|uniref:protein AF-10-like isoform X2 n=1 Tax=Sitodiplosis mosellana TaxID=263140 RepID=UPI002443AD45|nr:protein AF-10-like isoform X2 [Sitodiplosis mosellana]
MKEMVGGCCVCSDERGWSENPLVYCDGQHCTVAVHQACYGIVTVPTGNWYCRKCESQERPTRVRCELCPSKDGALKRTDNQGWAHVVCALYIPEVRFGNVTTMEPILLQLIPPERFNKVCYICQENNKGSKAAAGACMQCNKSGCKQQFHVTCAQARGLLCEEAGNYLDNVKYCGYCQHHYSKLKKGGNVKTIPPYKPVNHGIESSDPSSSPEKETDAVPVALIPLPAMSLTATNLDQKPSSQNGSHKSVQRKTNVSGVASSSSISSSASSSSSSSTTQQPSPFAAKPTGAQSQPGNQNTSQINTSSSSSNLSTDLLNVSGGDGGNSNSSNSTKESSSSKSSSKSNNKGNSLSTKSSSKEQREQKHSKPSRNHSKDSTPSEYDLPNASTTSDANVTPVSTASNKDVVLGQKFTTSNFTESIVVSSDSVFGSNGSSKPGSNVPVVKKRKLESIKSNTTDDMIREGIKDVSVTLVPLAYEKGEINININDTKKQKCAEPESVQNQHVAGGNTQQNIVKQTEDKPHHPATSVSLVVSVPLPTGVNLPSSNTSAPSIPSHHQISNIKSFANSDLPPNQHLNRSHNLPNVIVQQPAELQVRDPLLLSDKQTLVPVGAIVRNPSPSQSGIKLSSKGKGNTGNSSLFSELSTANTPSNMETLGVRLSAKTAHLADDVSLSRITSTPDDNSSSFSDLKISYEAQSNIYDVASITPRTDIKNSPPSSPSSEIAEPHKRNHSASNDGTKDVKVFPSKDMHVTHMLGNQLNPSSSVAQKMSDQLFMEMEAHSVYTSSSMDSNTQLMGPMFPGKQLNNARNSAQSQPQGPSLSSMLGGTGQPTAHGNTPQSLEQLLERQWEQGSQFLMEQAQHFDIASLLSCLHQLRSENIRLEEHVNNLIARRDHLLAVNARLAIPLNQVPQVQNQNSGTFNNLHLNGTTEPNSRSRSQHLK